MQCARLRAAQGKHFALAHGRRSGKDSALAYGRRKGTDSALAYGQRRKGLHVAYGRRGARAWRLPIYAERYGTSRWPSGAAGDKDFLRGCLYGNQKVITDLIF